MLPRPQLPWFQEGRIEAGRDGGDKEGNRGRGREGMGSLEGGTERRRGGRRDGIAPCLLGE